MALTDTLMGALGTVGKYSVLATQAVAEAEAQVGPGNGKTKMQVAMSYVLAAAHAGEAVPHKKIAAIAASINLAVGIANMLGVFGPTKATAEVVVPPVDPRPAKEDEEDPAARVTRIVSDSPH